MANYIFHNLKGNKEAFTLVELIISISLIAVVSAVGLASYAKSLSSSRDAKRKSDLEQIKGALEIYRSNSTNSAYPATLPTLQGSPKYINVPNDPRDNSSYAYVTSGAGYYVGATLEIGPTPACAIVATTLMGCTDFNSATSDAARGCNYCIGPYGVE